MTTLAGGGSVGGTSSGYLDGTGTAALFYKISDMAVDSSGSNLYIADAWNNRIRKIVISSGVVTTLAGSSSGYLDGTGTSARFNSPYGVTIDSTNSNLYVAEAGNNRVRKIVISSGEVTTLAGGTSGYLDGTGTAAQFNQLYGITIDSLSQNLYVTDLGSGNSLIRKIVISSGEVTTLAGGTSGYADGTGTSAKFANNYGITIDSLNQNLYVTDTNGQLIRKVVISSGAVTTLAGSTYGYSNGTGTAA